ncbi:hypothetical protein FD17_GL001142 [Lentilactobacillus sunkii DSM 19904]|uniref:Uncharacterized protein n=2 Tax=Lentilactobacillus sunkii TaxID=481719 RepID=A0A0R1L9A7_9LACO|nr:hypothetical protein FD17_GL001142 [Lentilactobacillus sunkii DSM 19904]
MAIIGFMTFSPNSQRVLASSQGQMSNLGTTKGTPTTITPKLAKIPTDDKQNLDTSAHIVNGNHINLQTGSFLLQEMQAKYMLDNIWTTQVPSVLNKAGSDEGENWTGTGHTRDGITGEGKDGAGVTYTFTDGKLLIVPDDSNIVSQTDTLWNAAYYTIDEHHIMIKCMGGTWDGTKKMDDNTYTYFFVTVTGPSSINVKFMPFSGHYDGLDYIHFLMDLDLTEQETKGTNIDNPSSKTTDKYTNVMAFNLPPRHSDDASEPSWQVYIPTRKLNSFTNQIFSKNQIMKKQLAIAKRDPWHVQQKIETDAWQETNGNFLKSLYDTLKSVESPKSISNFKKAVNIMKAPNPEKDYPKFNKFIKKYKNKHPKAYKQIRSFEKKHPSSITKERMKLEPMTRIQRSQIESLKEYMIQYANAKLSKGDYDYNKLNKISSKLDTVLRGKAEFKETFDKYMRGYNILNDVISFERAIVYVGESQNDPVSFINNQRDLESFPVQKVESQNIINAFAQAYQINNKTKSGYIEMTAHVKENGYPMYITVQQTNDAPDGLVPYTY